MTDNIVKQVQPHIADSAFGIFGELHCTALYSPLLKIELETSLEEYSSYVVH